MSAHTPGPWTLERELVMAGTKEIAQVKCVNHRYVDRVHFDETRDANAKLISAAPEMVAALKMFLAWYSTPEVHEPGSAAFEALAALKKAGVLP